MFNKVYTGSLDFWDNIYCFTNNDIYPSDEHSLTMMNCEIHADQTILPHLKLPKQPQVVEDTEEEGLRQPKLALRDILC